MHTLGRQNCPDPGAKEALQSGAFIGTLFLLNSTVVRRFDTQTLAERDGVFRVSPIVDPAVAVARAYRNPWAGRWCSSIHISTMERCILYMARANWWEGS